MAILTREFLKGPKPAVIARKLGVERPHAVGMIIEFYEDTQEAGVFVGTREELANYVAAAKSDEQALLLIDAMLNVDQVEKDNDGKLRIKGNKDHIDRIAELRGEQAELGRRRAAGAIRDQYGKFLPAAGPAAPASIQPAGPAIASEQPAAASPASASASASDPKKGEGEEDAPRPREKRMNGTDKFQVRFGVSAWKAAIRKKHGYDPPDPDDNQTRAIAEVMRRCPTDWAAIFERMIAEGGYYERRGYDPVLAESDLAKLTKLVRETQKEKKHDLAF